MITRLASIKNLFLLVYAAIILLVSVYSLKNPAYNWDMLPYMAVILSYDHADAATIHNNVYTIGKEKIPATFYNRMTDPSSQYRDRVLKNSEAFQQQLPFYVAKPLYTGAGYLFYKAGVSLPKATVWPSVIAYFFIGLLLFYWLQKHVAVFFAFAGSLLLMFSAPLLSVAKLSTPDAISGLLLFAAIYSIAETRSLLWTFIFLLLAVFARLDNIIPAIFFLTTIAFTNKWPGKISVSRYLLLLIGLLLTYFAVSFNTASFGWSLFYYPSFVKQLNPSYDINSSFVFKDYIALVKSQLMTGLFFSFLSLFCFLVLLLLWNAQPLNFKQLNLEQTVAIVFALVILTRFVLQPLITDRLYIPYYLSIMVFLVKKYSFAMNGQPYYKR
jgi:hypothetical protein